MLTTKDLWTGFQCIYVYVHLVVNMNRYWCQQIDVKSCKNFPWHFLILYTTFLSEEKSVVIIFLHIFRTNLDNASTHLNIRYKSLSSKVFSNCCREQNCTDYCSESPFSSVKRVTICNMFRVDQIPTRLYELHSPEWMEISQTRFKR